MKRNLNTTIQLPAGLILSEHIIGYEKGWDDKYRWLINSIIYNRYTTGAPDKEFTILNAKLLIYYLGTDFYNKVITQLANSGIIEVNKHYTVGKHSRGYRLGAKWRGKELVNTKLGRKENQYFNKVIKHRTGELKKMFSLNPLLQAEFLKLSYFRIDVKAASAFVKSEFEPNTDSYKYYMNAIRNYNEMHKSSFSSSLYNTNFTFVYTGGRLYSPVTQLPRLLEKFTYENGKKNIPLVGLDMAASQIKFYDLEMNGKPKHPSKFLDYQKVIWDDNQDCYLNLMELYEYKGKSKNHTKEERQKFKREVYWKELMYNKFNPNHLTKLEKVMKQHYPQYFYQLQEAKRKLGVDGNKKLARSIHSLEGKFFHVTIVNSLEALDKSLNYNIKHDCVKVSEDNAERVKAVVDTLASELFGRTVNLEIE